MKFKLKLFASFREVLGASEIDYEMPDGSTAQDLVDEILSKSSSLERFRGHLIVTKNRTSVPLSEKIEEGDEIAILPPVSGG